MNLFLLFRSNKTYLKGCALIRLSHELQIASVTPITPITLTLQLMVSYLILSPTFFGSKIFVDWHEMVNGHRRADNMKHLSLIITA